MSIQGGARAEEYRCSAKNTLQHLKETQKWKTTGVYWFKCLMCAESAPKDCVSCTATQNVIFVNGKFIQPTSFKVRAYDFYSRVKSIGKRNEPAPKGS